MLFFEPKNFMEHKLTDYIFIHNFLIYLQGYIKHLVDYGVSKIPKDCTNENQAPIIYSISHLINRAFLFFNFSLEQTENSTENNEFIVAKLCSEFFVKCQSEHQVKTILQKLSQIIVDTTKKEEASNLSNSGQLNNLIEFIKIIRTLLVKNRFSEYKYEDYMSILYSVLNLTIQVLDKISDQDFMLIISVLQSLIIKILTLDLNFETKSLDLNMTLENENDDYTEEQMIIDDPDIR